MTNKEIRIAIAESLGFTISDSLHEKIATDHLLTIAGVLDYPNSLDDCAEFIHAISKDPVKRVKFLNSLRGIVGRRMPKNKVGIPLVSDFDLIEATPAEYCEAYLRGEGLWRD